MPHPLSCVGNFINTSVDVLKEQVEKVGFIAPGSADKACPWWDRGYWPRALPENFLELTEDQARRVATERTCQCPGRSKEQSNYDHGEIGLMYMWELATLTKKLRPMPKLSILSTAPVTQHPMWAPKKQNSNSSSTNSANASTSSSTAALPPQQRIHTKNAPGGVLIFAGDSMTRQLFSRMVHRIRSRECTSEAEFRRKAVFELQIHETAAYVATTLGDAFILAPSCEQGLDFLSTTLPPRKIVNKYQAPLHGENETSSNNGHYIHHKILFQACFVWDNTDTSLQGTVANLHKMRDRVAALLFVPQMWHCGTLSESCMSANQSSGAVMSVIGAAAHYSIPRVVVTTNVIRQTFFYYQMAKVKHRNRQMKQLFPFFPDEKNAPFVRSMMLPRNFAKHKYDDIDPDEKDPSSWNAGTIKEYPEFYWSNVRLYDLGGRHALLAPEQCDVVHGMCMFLPARSPTRATSVRSLFGGKMCPSAEYGKCQDMSNFVLLEEIMMAFKV
jgi:hypothetical protein